MIKVGKYRLVFGRIGNCFTNILHVELTKLTNNNKTVKIAWCGDTRENLDTVITFNKWYVPIRITWNSTKLAKKFGVALEAPFGTYHIWDSKFLGQHVEI